MAQGGFVIREPAELTLAQSVLGARGKESVAAAGNQYFVICAWEASSGVIMGNRIYQWACRGDVYQGT